MPDNERSGNRYRSWDSDSLRYWIEKRERMVSDLMAEVDTMRRELARRGEERADAAFEADVLADDAS